ncbi:MAG: (Fe-S)-binding protein [Rhodocyclaceae bacterium]|nr:(Fe-S)-binding protein [Rhodocyclaceae bacterium]
MEKRTYPGKPRDVYLYATCLVDMFHPDAGMDTVALLEREGIRVHFPRDQTCCGQPAYTSGYPEEAREVARKQLDLFPLPWPVVVPSGSCGGMMRHHYPRLFADEPEARAKALALADRVFELSEFLVHVVQVKLTDRGSAETVALHTSCSARREMGTHLTGADLLAQLCNVKLEVHGHESECCGFGGTFSLKQPDISSAMAADKVAAMQATGARGFISADCGCLLNLNHTLEARKEAFRGEHLATFLCRRTGAKP